MKLKGLFMGINNDDEKSDAERIIELLNTDPESAKFLALEGLKDPIVKKLESTGLRFFLEYIYIRAYYLTMSDRSNSEGLMLLVTKYKNEVIEIFSNEYMHKQLRKDQGLLEASEYFGLHIFLMYAAIVSAEVKSSPKFEKEKNLMADILQEYIQQNEDNKPIQDLWNDIIQ